MNKEERKALINFLAIYMLSALILVGIIAFLYYKKEVVNIEDRCSVDMTNAAINIEKDLMHSSMEKIPYKFVADFDKFRVGLFQSDGKKLYSNLKDDTILLSKTAYKSNFHEYHINKLKDPILDIQYIVIQGNESANQKYKLISIMAIIILASTIFIGFIGYLLSRLLVAPIKQRVEKLNCFIKDSAHDINTPVSALMMSVSSLRGKAEVDKRVLNHISTSAKLISQIYNSLSFLAFNEKDAVLNMKFDLELLVQESVKFFDEIAYTKHNVIKCELESTYVVMDPSRIRQVINNLISNSIKYSYSNSLITISLKDNVFSIEDKGVGIEKKDIDAIFTRYERKSKDIGGFGIGLDIVKTVCKMYAIKIDVKSVPKIGTKFYLIFPKEHS